LEIKDETAQAQGDVVFEFLDEAEVTSGLVVIVINLDTRRLSLWLDGELAASDFACDDGGPGEYPRRSLQT
jgi:hypothetical protein